MREIALVWTNCGSAGEAVRLGRSLVEARLAACANVEPIRSIYRWEGELREEEEHRLLVKMRRNGAEAAAALLQREHSYDLPAVLIEAALVTDAYADWVEAESGGEGVSRVTRV